jgi:outer membrane lipoprotein-sorting protein
MKQKTPAQPPAKPAAPPKWESIAQTKIQDLRVVLHVAHKETNFAELGKISREFATTYRVSQSDVSYKYPNKMRFEATLLGLKNWIVYNGDTKFFKTALLSRKENVYGKPGNKQSLMDIGIFAMDWLKTDYDPKFLRQEGALLVYHLKQRNTDSKSYELIWLNPKTAITERRQSWNGWKNTLNKEVRYKNPVEVVPGVFVPTRIEIYNQFGKLGAVQNVEKIRLNQGVSEELFATS